ncbi:MAG: ketol-acid reductoisomerase, partial [Candidatus Sulfotelmatobacter sp.]
RYSISDTAEHGDYTGGPRIVTDQTRQAMKQLLKEIQDGTYARNWIAENESGREWFETTRQREQEHEIERVGERLRGMMKFLDPVTVKQSRKRPPVPA